VHVRIPERHLGPVHQEGTTIRPHEDFPAETPAGSEPVSAAQDVA
jgi:hypothetical protein